MKFPVYEVAREVLMHSTQIHVVNIFPGFTSIESRSTSPVVINNLFSDFIDNNFHKFYCDIYGRLCFSSFGWLLFLYT